MREPSTVWHYRQRADSFYQAAQLLDLDVTYGPAVGLLAVHSSIALTDAVLVAEEGARSKEDSHGVAANQLEKLCLARGLDRVGLRYLRDLLSKKTRFSYGEDAVRDDEFKSAKVKMEQYTKWVYGTFPRLAQMEVEDV